MQVLQLVVCIFSLSYMSERRSLITWKWIIFDVSGLGRETIKNSGLGPALKCLWTAVIFISSYALWACDLPTNNVDRRRSQIDFRIIRYCRYCSRLRLYKHFIGVGGFGNVRAMHAVFNTPSNAPVQLVIISFHSSASEARLFIMSPR